VYAETAPDRVDQSVIIGALYFYAVDEHFPAAILTPACDFEQSKAELVTACALVEAWALISSLVTNDWANQGFVTDSGLVVPLADLSKGKLKTYRERVSRLIKNQYPRYHWLAPLPGSRTPLVADFQLISALPVDELADARLIAILASPFREELPARYAAYMSRVGTPDHASETVEAWLDASLQAVFQKKAG
jgi:hypothetical protein